MTLRALRPLLLTLAALAGNIAHAQEAPVAVLTDTAAYCVQLQRLILERPIRPPDINRLLVEGRRMCDHGEVRPGILRLRRALWMMHHRVATP